MGAASKGIVGKKLGMTQIFDEEAKVIPVTVIEAGPCKVTQVKTPDIDGYAAIQIAFGSVPERKLTKAQLGHLAKSESAPLRELIELRIQDTSSFEVGQELKADIFQKGERADVVGVSKGKGFTGAMKRWNFHGLPKTHGTSGKHRSPGSIGACATPSRVFKGMKMAGKTGAERVTVLNLEVVETDPERNLILIRGAIPGPRGGLVMVRSSTRGAA